MSRRTLLPAPKNPSISFIWKENMDFARYLKKNLEDPQFRQEWDALEAETQIMRSMIEARLETGMTQKQLSEKTRIKHS